MSTVWDAEHVKALLSAYNNDNSKTFSVPLNEAAVL